MLAWLWDVVDCCAHPLGAFQDGWRDAWSCLLAFVWQKQRGGGVPTPSEDVWEGQATRACNRFPKVEQ